MTEQHPRTLLCFGDSNTYGIVPITDFDNVRRHGPNERWSGVVADQLGESWQVVADGLPGRTTVHADPVEGEHLKGLDALPVALKTNAPIDVVALMLGTNDLKNRFSVNATDIAQSNGRLIDIIRRSGAGPDGTEPGVLLIAPPPIHEVGPIGEVFIEGSRKSERLGRAFHTIATQHGTAFVDAGAIIESGMADGIHLDATAHRKLGEAVAAKLSTVF